MASWGLRGSKRKPVGAAQRQGHHRRVKGIAQDRVVAGQGQNRVEDMTRGHNRVEDRPMGRSGWRSWQ